MFNFAFWMPANIFILRSGVVNHTRTIDSLVKRLVSSENLAESFDIIDQLDGILDGEFQSLQYEQALTLMTLLEKISDASETSEDYARLSRETAKVMYRGLLIRSGGFEELRPVYSPLMVQTKDPFVLIALCRILWRYTEMYIFDALTNQATRRHNGPTPAPGTDGTSLLAFARDCYVYSISFHF
eukprot:Protomagalhaensia_wolfi_Nauph_80__4825@NODE_503_length_2419_cov_77_231092_g376_i0_p3_GENE_NODE_503_length_2419_cov_77_231092_g376_i0NODE_503_length_2419_cov_77_231092_g376_i0_p3_ORF_typecomplete_len185_score16_35PDEase_I/PF00233_19/0_19_NODE_503_length_2419_cov_77_231092_g376_i012811835